MEPTKIGIIGCGNISGIYFKAGDTFDILEIAACADLIPERAREKAEKHDIPRACTVDELLNDPKIQIIVNLTTPDAHEGVATAALEAGKSVHNEKPLALTRAQGRHMLTLARDKGLRIGGAPDTFLGGAHQTCRALIDEGAIGQPVAATAFMMCHGHESWHPDPEFYYRRGGGPLFDMGPYYLTALINLMGPIRSVSASARITFPERTITSKPKQGTKISVDTPTHIAGTLDFESGAIGTLIMSFDIWAHHLPPIEVHGTEGSLAVPDPNGFGGAVTLRRHDGKQWTSAPLTHGYIENSRGIGVADMAYALRSGRPHRASGDLAYHVLDVMQAFLDAAESGARIAIESTCERPAPLPLRLEPGFLDE